MNPQTLKVEIAQLSDPGRDPNKQINEDSCGYAKTRFGHLCVLCDGMGGHYGGQEASRRAITSIFEHIEKSQEGTSPAIALKLAIEEAARKVYEFGGTSDNRARPGSTVVALLMHDNGADVAHVGDSRVYIVRSNQIYPLTRDHSMVQGMIDAGMLTEEQAIGHPDANKITRALGMKPDVEVDVRPEAMELFVGDLLLLTSDGLTDLALNQDILQVLNETLRIGTLNDACFQLVKMANDRGGHDNITVQLARVLRTAPKLTRVGTTEPPGVGPTLGAVALTEVEQRAGTTIPIPRSPEPQATIHDGGRVGPTVVQPPEHNAPAQSFLAGPASVRPAQHLQMAPPPSPSNQGSSSWQPLVYYPGAHPGVQPTPNEMGPPSVPYSIRPASDGARRSALLFLWLGASFFLAAVALFVVWAAFLR